MPKLRPDFLGSIDRRTTLIAGFSFLAHFGAVGSVYADWTDPIVDNGARVATLVEELRALPAVPADPSDLRAALPPFAPGSPARDATLPAMGALETPLPDDRKRAALHPGRRGQEGDAPAAKAEIAPRSSDARVTPSLDRGGSSIDRVLRGATLPPGILDDLGRATAASDSPRASPLDPGGLPATELRPGAGPLGLPGERAAFADQQRAGTARAVGGPANGAPLPRPSGDPFLCRYPGTPSLRVPVKQCYHRALAEDPAMQGSLIINLDIGPGGEVRGAQASGVTGTLSRALIVCVQQALRGMHFDPGHSASVSIPLSFRQ